MAVLCRGQTTSILARLIGIDYIMTTEFLQSSVSPVNRWWPGSLTGIILVPCMMSYLTGQEASSLYCDHVDSGYKVADTSSNTSSSIRIFRWSWALLYFRQIEELDTLLVESMLPNTHTCDWSLVSQEYCLYNKRFLYLEFDNLLQNCAEDNNKKIINTIWVMHEIIDKG